ncbi:MAG: fumarate hydratase [Slackia sp.]|nr:fumarate hydratase [Slackia sp.]
MDTFAIITKEDIARAVYDAIPRIACELPCDVRMALERAREAEGCTRGAFVLDQLIENARIAEADRVPLCQDTGTVWVCLEAGPDVCVPGDAFSLVDKAVARAYDEARLRKSVVRDALFDRANTGDNTPAFTDVHFVERPGARVHVMLKGGGSDNASRVVMLAPGAGRDGIVREVMDCVRAKAANACPPLVIGIGVGSTFDKVAHLAKTALLRPIGERARDAQAAAFERELLERVNATGMGPGALGGRTLALDVHVETAPCHIAALPLAINMGCSAMRRATVELPVSHATASGIANVRGDGLCGRGRMDADAMEGEGL